MLRSKRMWVVALAGVLAGGLLVQNVAFGRSPVRQYVHSLKGQFAIFSLNIRGRGTVTGANPIELDDHSPLEPLLGNDQDVLITHLDGRRTTSFRELENHVRRTTVRWINTRTGEVHRGTIYIPE